MGSNTNSVHLAPAPLAMSANRWTADSLSKKAQATNPDCLELVNRTVKALLNKLTMAKFDYFSDIVINWANKSGKEKDGQTLIQVTRLVYDHAIDHPAWPAIYARLCRKMVAQISRKVQDDKNKNNEGKPIAGEQLFRTYLLKRCQEDFERGWAIGDVVGKANSRDKAAKMASDKGCSDDEESVVYTDEYHAAQRAKRRGLGLMKFIGELFKLQMFTGRIMHEYIKKSLGNIGNPDEEKIESLCTLLTTVGKTLDTSKARAHMDIYFSRMKELMRSGNVSLRMQSILQVCIFAGNRRYLSLYFRHRILLSYVIANGLHII